MKSNKSALYTIAILIVIIIIGIIYIYSSRASAPTVNEIVVSPTPTVSGTSSMSVSPTVTTTSKVNLYFVALNTPGISPIGCGDGLVGVLTPIPATQAPLSAALSALFSNHSKDVGAYYNSLYGSNLKVDSATITNGAATVKISGTVSLGGVCDDPRFVSQIKQTVMQFPTIKSAIITINGKLLESYGSEKGE